MQEVTPWFADAPAAELSLSQTEADMEIGGRPARVKVSVAGRRPGDVSGNLTVRARDGLRVTAPTQVTAPRGGTATAEVEIAVPAGTKPGAYRLPIRFGSEEVTLTVRAHHRTGGPDLARKARATSSANETAEFPASAVIDGDPSTRWSSPATDHAWLQLELDRPTRLGRVDLHWQDAHASRYRIQVSPDGRTWRTAATVQDSAGGRRSTWTPPTPASYGSRATSARHASGTRCGRYGLARSRRSAVAVTAGAGRPVDEREGAQGRGGGEGGARGEAPRKATPQPERAPQRQPHSRTDPDPNSPPT